MELYEKNWYLQFNEYKNKQYKFNPKRHWLYFRDRFLSIFGIPIKKYCPYCLKEITKQDFINYPIYSIGCKNCREKID